MIFLYFRSLLKEIIQYNIIMSVVAFMNVSDNNVINDIDEAYPRYSPSWSLVEKIRMELSPIFPPSS